MPLSTFLVLNDQYSAEEQKNVLAHRLPWYSVVGFTLVWITLMLCLCASFSEIHLLDQETLVMAPRQQHLHDYQSVTDNLKFYWDSGAKPFAMFLALGFYIIPITKLVGSWVFMFAPLTDSRRFFLIYTFRKTARVAIGPIIVVYNTILNGTFKIQHHLGPLHIDAEITNIPKEGTAVQMGIYLSLLVMYDFLLISNGIEPKFQRSFFRTLTLGASAGCQLAFFSTAFLHVHVGGIFGDYLLNPKLDQRANYFSDYFEKLPFIEGYPDYSYHFFFWLIFCIVLPCMAMFFHLVNQVFDYERLDFITKRLNNFWIYDILVVLYCVRVVSQKKSDQYFIHEKLAKTGLCDINPEAECFFTKVILVDGYWWLLAGVVLYYIDHWRLVFSRMYEYLQRKYYGEPYNGDFQRLNEYGLGS